MEDQVRIEIYGGIPYIIKCPKNIELNIYDFDVEGVEEEDICTCIEVDKPHIHHIKNKGEEIEDN